MDTKDIGFLLTEMALLGPFCLLVVFPALLHYFTPSFVLAIALSGNAGVMVMIGTIWAKWPIYAFAAPMAGIIQLVTPVLLSTVSNTGPPQDVAKRITAINAVSDLCSAVAPLPFSVLYKKLTGSLVGLPFFISAGLCAIAVFLATRIAPSVETDVRIEVQEHLVPVKTLPTFADVEGGRAETATPRSTVSAGELGDGDETEVLVQRLTEARLRAASLQLGHGLVNDTPRTFDGRQREP